MEKIHLKHSDKDRIACLSISNKQVFYYQAVNSRVRKYLFESKFSYSVYKYFCKKGRSLPDGGFYLTVADLYRFRDYHNVKLTHTLERLPAWIDYVLTNDTCAIKQTVPVCCPVHTMINECSDERAA